MATKVLNTGRVALQVGIILADGTKTTSRIMPRGRADLKEGTKVDPNWMALNGKSVKVVEEEQSINVAAATASVDDTKAVTVNSDSTVSKSSDTAPVAPAPSETEVPSSDKSSAETVNAKESTQ